MLQSSDFTVEAWATTNSFVPWQRIIDVGNPGGKGFIILTPYNNGYNQLGQVSIASAGGASDTNYVTANPPHALSTRRQYHHVYVHGRTAGLESLYIDGSLVGTSAATVDPALASYTAFYIGRSNFAADPYWVGSINEVRTYDSALPAQQVAADFAAGPTTPEPATLASLGIAGWVALARRRRSR